MSGWRIVASCVTVTGVLIAGCGRSDGEHSALQSDAPQDDSLPAPEAGRQGVTGMPSLPGPGAIGPPDPFSSDGAAMVDGVLETSSIPEASSEGYFEGPAGQPLTPDRPAEEPGSLEAAAVVRQYYAALDNGDFTRAFRLWSDGGAASGRSLQQFADSFSGTASRTVEILEPGRIDAAAGSRYIEVPVAIQETRHDGSMLRQVGAYTLRRAMVDGADAQQRAWRISSADLREVRP